MYYNNLSCQNCNIKKIVIFVQNVIMLKVYRSYPILCKTNKIMLQRKKTFWNPSYYTSEDKHYMLYSSFLFLKGKSFVICFITIDQT